MLTNFRFDNFLHSLCFRRSLSPISMRPSTLGPVKRKCDMDDYEPISKKWGLLITNNRYIISFLYHLFTNKIILHQNIKCILMKLLLLHS